MRFSQDCLSATLNAVTSLLVSQSDDMEGKFIGALTLMKPAWVVAVTAGIAVSCIISCLLHLSLLQANHHGSAMSWTLYLHADYIATV